MRVLLLVGSMNIGAHEMHQAFMCFVLQRKLDDQLGNMFEQHLGSSTELPKVDILLEFLKKTNSNLGARQYVKIGNSRLLNPTDYRQGSWEAGQKVVNPSRFGVNCSGSKPEYVKSTKKSI